VLLFILVPPLTKSGLWDPYELNVAELARRVALNMFGASSLALGGADNSLPHLNDLGRPQGPFTLIALGFKVFGLHEWAGRLPLAVVGVLGVLATYAFVARLFDRRTGALSAIALCTMPLYFVQARSILGDILTMASLACSFGGLAVAAFDRDEKGPTALGARLPWLGLAAVGLFAGLESRGALIGVGVPLLGVGLGWLVGRVAAGPQNKSQVGAGRSADVVGDVVGGVALLAGVGVAAAAVRVIAAADTKDMNLWVGALLHTPSKYPTFDATIASIGHALAPWSAFLPFALGRLFIDPPGRTGALAERESLGRSTVLLGAAVALVAHGYIAARTDLIAFCGPVLCAVACAVAIRDFERGAGASTAVGLGTLLLAAVLHHDFHELPEKAYQAFGVTGANFPESFKEPALLRWWVVLGGFALVFLVTWSVELPRSPSSGRGDRQEMGREPFDPDNYAKVLRQLHEMFDGILALLYFTLVALCSLAALGLWILVRVHSHWPPIGTNVRDFLLNLWWVIAFVPLGLLFGVIWACDVWLWAFGKSRPLSQSSLARGFDPFVRLINRAEEAQAKAKRVEDGKAEPAAAASKEGGEWWIAMAILGILVFFALPGVVFLGAWLGVGLKWYVALLLGLPSGLAFFMLMGVVGDLLRNRGAMLALAGVAAGFVLCVSYYPALANQLSPKEVFESYQQVCPGSPLALLGVGGRTSAYYAGATPQTLNDPASAYSWLTAGGPGQRRCLAMKADELPKLNQLWREHAADRGGGATNLPVLDARSSQILLAASTLGDAKDENPLSALVLTSPPHPQRRIDANMDDKLEVIGIDLVDDRGHLVDAITPGRACHLKTYYRVLAPVTTEWEAFIHIDGYHRRHNGDHKPMNAKYPMSLWLPGDLLVDDHEFKLEPNFTPGSYTIYFGLFVGDTRLKVKSGPNDGDNRVNGGALKVQ
jgi:hypothetical protein